jgi:hypothetical protein
VAAIVFAAATVHRFHWLGGPYFTFRHHPGPRVPARFRARMRSSSAARERSCRAARR